MKTIRKMYLESEKSKQWMDKNLKPQEQSGFIRSAVEEKIIRIKSAK